MTAEKEFKRENGDTIKVVAFLELDLLKGTCGGGMCYVIKTYQKLNGENKFKEVECFKHGYFWFNQKNQKCGIIATVSEINEVKHLLIDQLRETIADKID